MRLDLTATLANSNQFE